LTGIVVVGLTVLRLVGRLLECPDGKIEVLGAESMVPFPLELAPLEVAPLELRAVPLEAVAEAVEVAPEVTPLGATGLDDCPVGDDETLPDPDGKIVGMVTVGRIPLSLGELELGGEDWTPLPD